MKIKMLLVFMIVFTVSLVAAEVSVTLGRVENYVGDSNSSEYWDNLNDINNTQMENSGTVLSILESWLLGIFVPYTGATGNLDLGDWGYIGNSILFGDIGASNFTLMGNYQTHYRTEADEEDVYYISQINLSNGDYEFRRLLGDNNFHIGFNTHISGNITSENVFIPQYIFSHTNRTIPVLGVGTWTNVTFDQEDTYIKSGINHIFNDATNNSFMIMEDGIYNVNYDLDVEDTSVNANVAGRLILANGTEVKGSIFEIDITQQNSEEELSHNFLVRGMAGESFVVQFTGSDSDVQVSTHGTYGDHPESATLVINKIANIK